MKIQTPDNQWLQYLQDAYHQLLSAAPFPFSKLTPSTIPAVSGVYVITAKLDGKHVPYYVGRSKNLRQRLYKNHLMGPLTNARLKKYLIKSGECGSLHEAKEFIKACCWARWIGEPDIRVRGAIEGYVTGMLFPKYGIYEEH
ncbi:MAG TPA: GIY-YIG nuclease family protein [Syntrophorhabdaceae bacterium]|nr:GIY-YIG nuclease family protein [Syntrophorhabdaceae bacterium]